MINKNYPEPNIPVKEAWAEMKNLLKNHGETKPPEQLKPLAVKYMAYAGMGILIIAAVAFYLLKEKKPHQSLAVLYSSQNYPKNETLSNGTGAFLNKFSSISEMVDDSAEKLFTVKGSAYFKEAALSVLPVRRLKIGSLLVLPMQANIYVSFDTVSSVSSVQIQSGSAVIVNGEEKITLNAGESIWYDETSMRMSNKQKIDMNVFSYATKVFEFTDTPLKEAAELIENAYGFKILFKNEKLFNCRITTRFDNKGLNEIFDIMSYTLGFTYQIDEKEKQVIIKGGGCE